ncbi:MAG: glycosyltransferase family 39 protein [Burkholderiales bacterium]
MSGAPPARALLVLALVLALAWFGLLGVRPLVKADEGRYGEIPREMVASGDWLTPRLNGFRYFEKPPLQYWATATVFRVLGPGEWGTRLWGALAAFAALLGAAWTGARLYGPAAGFAAAAALAGSFYFAALSQLASLDAGVSAFLSLAVFAIVIAQLEDTPAPRRRRWMLAAWAAMALAVLSKGLIGLVLPAGAVLAYALWQRNAGLLRRLHVVSGGLLFLAIAAPWFVAESAANPEFARFFFWHEHVERFLTTEHHHAGPWWYFVPVLLLGALPWLPSLLAAPAHALRQDPPTGFRPARLLLAWCGLVFLFFSASGSKLASYLLPIFPALGLLIGAQLAQASRRFLATQAALAALLGLAALAWLLLGAPGAASGSVPPEFVARYRVWLIAAAASLAAAGLAAAAFARNDRAPASIAALSAGGLACVLLTVVGYGTLAPIYSAYDAVERSRPSLPPAQVPFYAVRRYDHTLPFYLGRTVTMVDVSDELATAMSWEPGKAIASVAEFARAWREAPAACAAFAPGEYESIRTAHGLAAHEIARSPRYVIACKP